MDKLYGYENSNAASEKTGAKLTNLKAPGAPVLLKNVPYKISYKEILSFFGKFKVVNRSIILCTDPRTRKNNGEAAILFSTVEEAALAVEKMNK